MSVTVNKSKVTSTIDFILVTHVSKWHPYVLRLFFLFDVCENYARYLVDCGRTNRSVQEAIISFQVGQLPSFSGKF